jgi:hypothetical protein
MPVYLREKKSISGYSPTNLFGQVSIRSILARKKRFPDLV